MNPLPLPLRLAAGLVATAVEQARDLPRLMIEFPVTAISQTLQVSMRMQQKVTELAIKGDRALGVLRPVEETPAWATFDDEDRRPGATGRARSPRCARRAAGPPRAGRPAPPGPPPNGSPRTPPPAPPPTSRRAPPRRSRMPEPPADVTTGGEDASGPNALPGYREMSIPQLRARLRKLSEPDLRALLAWETAHDNRPPFVTMLTNRITTVTED